MTGLAVDDAAWASAWRRRSPGDKLLLCLGLVVCALVLPVWPGSLLVGLTAVVLALGPARVPARTFLRAVRLPLAFVAIGAGIGIAALGSTAMGTAAVGADRQGMASGLLNTAAQLGNALGPAVCVLLATAGVEAAFAAAAALAVVAALGCTTVR